MAQNFEVSTDFLIIGCTSEIGSRLLRNLLSLGYKVDGIRNKSNCETVSENHRCVSVDLFATDLEYLATNSSARIVILVSWYTKHKDFWDSPLNNEWSKMYKRLCQAFIDKGVEGFVGIGSCAEYSWLKPVKISELSETIPASRYGIEKLGLYNWLNQRVNDLLWVRPFFVYGPNDHPDKLIQATITKRVTNSAIAIQNSQDIVDYVFIEDVALITMQLISIGAKGVFNIGTGKPSSPLDIAKILGCDYELDDGSSPRIIQDSKYVVADTERVTKVLGRIEWISLSSGISNMLASRDISKK